jgi:Uma2 family endonuclease
VVVSARQRFTFDDYLALEETSQARHEFLGGSVWAMAGGTPEHAAVCANLVAVLSNALRGRRCRVFTSDVRIRVLATGLATYPDATVVCERLETDPEDPKGHTLVNPQVIVEVLSPSTEDYDRGEKLAHYKQISSLREIVLVAHDEPRLELWRREADRWILEVVRGNDVAALPSCRCALDLAEVYRNPLAPGA